ncbi:GyrI-like domain-containing protein [Oceanobacter sp. 5_MG-2023]|uniref:GyrI-like domain-containing protein n=1 Tax=Oceanobacter sp. 5_MG-2023 TaxID=3062645 RepID=UPI0026E13148|nr:GyrI-like domain-containing protein [Oceanobacter sp. 5_MG-2023]MDO6682215.1 GyrI-like domain-containing protein [Oceanobacter sp. 5_MG-2023]
MYVTQINEKTVKGIKVRTKNADEMSPDTSKISGLWHRFYRDIAPTLSKEASILGVYCNYESDFTGEFEELAGSDMIKGDGAVDSVTIKGGRYLVFEGNGSMPQTVIDTWSKIWEYFGSDNPEYTRAYTTDFESYKSDSEIQIFIAIE